MSNKDNEPATIVGLVATEGIASGKENEYFLPQDASCVDLKSACNGPVSVCVESRLRDENMLVAGSQLGQHFSDEYRRIKRPLLANAFGKSASLVDQGNLILVTSSLPGEGKTTTSTNLALSIAQEKDHTVLLVDCDINKQGISRLFGLGNQPGLVDVLESDSLSIGDVLLRTDIPELCVVSAGKGDEYVTELLASQRMSDLVAEMVSRYDDRIIIFDGPPLLPTPQTQILAGLVGQIVFVIEAGKTPQMLVEEAVEMLPEEKAVGLLMNKTEGKFGRSGYYYGYYGSDQ
jgi:exopolysaccharide/PEP-CTERM locus tyrosine autokinase